MSEILVLVEHTEGDVKKVTLELLTKARALGSPAAVYIGAGLNSPTAQVPTMVPLVTLVPEPTLLSLATALYVAIGRRRRS